MCIYCDLFGGSIMGCLDDDDDQTTKIERIRGKSKDFVGIHLDQCKTALALGGNEWESLIDQLFDRVTDLRNLEAAWQHLVEFEKQNPGKTEFGAVVDLTDKQIRLVLKELRRTLRNPKYMPTEGDAICWAILSHLTEKIGQTAMCAVVEPLLVEGLDPLTLTAGSEEARLNSLNATLSLATKENRLMWALVSAKDPFNNVPQDPLFDELWEILPNKKCFQLITGLTWMPDPNGISEGNRLSELLIDMYLDRTVVRKWREVHENVPLIRCGADFLILSQTKNDAKRMRADLLDILGKAAMPIDESSKSTICDLAAGETAEWLGYTISRQAEEWFHEPVGSV